MKKRCGKGYTSKYLKEQGVLGNVNTDVMMETHVTFNGGVQVTYTPGP